MCVYNVLRGVSSGVSMLRLNVQNYCLSVYLVEQLTTNTLLERLKKFGKRHADCTWALSKFTPTLSGVDEVTY